MLDINNVKVVPLLSVEESVYALLVALSTESIINDPNFKDTPRRVAKYFREHFVTVGEVEHCLGECKKAVFPSTNSEMVVQRGISVIGMCPHHLLPVYYKVAVGYLPHGRVIGLSKLSRVADICLRQPVLQESGTVAVAEALAKLLETKHVAVLVEGAHSCMSIRGVKMHNSVTITAELSGAFKEHSHVRAEFYSIARKEG